VASYVSIAKRVPWMKVWAAAAWLAHQSRERLAKLDDAERRELLGIVTASKGRPGNVSKRDRGRLRDLVKKAARGG
jgi:hypothetical protein